MLIRRGGGNRIAEMLHDDYENYNDLEYTTERSKLGRFRSR